MTAEPFATVVGQPRAVAMLEAAVGDPVHAYLFLGPRGSGRRRAAACMAGELVGSAADRDRNRLLCQREEHPDLVLFEPVGQSFRKEEAEAIVVEASRAPTEAGRKVIVIDRFQDATPEAAAKLLKPIEEPNPSIVFILLSEFVPPEHITIASRSTTVDFPAVSSADITAALIAKGIDPDVARSAGEASNGDVGRAELLVADDAFAHRRELWWDVPTRLDGSGSAVGELIAEIRTAVDAAQAPLDARHVEESEAMDATEELTGTRGSGRRAMEARHKREARLHRNDEWQMGLSTLAHRYRTNLLDSNGADDLSVFDLLRDASEALVRNPNEELWLAGFLLKLPTGV